MGCSGPNQANIQLRKDKQELESRIETLRSERDAGRARIESLERRWGTTPMLPQNRLDRMFTAHELRLGSFSGGTDLNPSIEGDEALKVYVTPVDENSDPLPATGKVVIEAFDLAKAADNRIGRWEFDSPALKQNWRSLGAVHAFVLVCPWQKMPEHAELTLKVSFEDELTGRVLTAQRTATVKLPTGRR
jgi:hypothetical protein